MQETDFEFEILINDDASTDGTKEIIEEYRKKYPKIIKPVFHKKNQFSQGKRNMIIRYLLPNAKGKYLAICEGDDYWTDPNKLQKQVDFMEKNPDYSICFHPVKVIFEKKEKKDHIYPKSNRIKDFTILNLLKGNFIQTNSVMYRKQPNYEDLATRVMPGDWYLHLYHAQFGKIGFINEIMTVYRRHQGGVWWQKENEDIKSKYAEGYMYLFVELLKIFGKNHKYREVIFTHINNMTEVLKVDHDNYLILYPEYIKQFVNIILYSQNYIIINKSKTLKAKEEYIAVLEYKMQHLKQEISLIKNSKKWRLCAKIATILTKIMRKS